MMFAENAENFYQTAASAVITGLLWHCCPFSSLAELARDKWQRVPFCGFAWRLGGVGCFLLLTEVGRRMRWYGGRLVSERLRQWYRDNPFAWLGRKAFA